MLSFKELTLVHHNLQLVTTQVVGKKGKRENTKRTQSQLSDWAKEDIGKSWGGNRAAYQIGKEHNATPSLVLELILRKHDKWLKKIDMILSSWPPPTTALQRMPPKRQEQTEQIRRKTA